MSVNKKSLEFGLDKYGSIINPPFHDANLSGINISEKDGILHFVTTENAKYELCLMGLVQIKANNFSKGNIVLDVILSNGGNGEVDLLVELYGVDSETEKTKPYFQDLIKQVREKHLTIVQVNPSYGCELLALCKEIKIYLVE